MRVDLRQDGDNHEALLVGAGNFGYALLAHLTRERPSLRLDVWDRDPSVRGTLRADGRHPHEHPGVHLAREVRVLESESEIGSYDFVILAVESSAVGDATAVVAANARSPVLVMNTARALDVETGQRLSRVVAERAEGRLAGYAVLSGSLSSRDLVLYDPLRVRLAGEDAEQLGRLAGQLGSGTLRVRTTTQLAQEEFRSAFGNIVAVMAGLLEGAGLSHGAQAWVVASLAAELESLVEIHAATSSEALAREWADELYLCGAAPTAVREFGTLLGRGFSVDDALAAMSQGNRNVEGYRTITALGKLGGLEALPLLTMLFDFVVGVIARDELIREICASPEHVEV